LWRKELARTTEKKGKEGASEKARKKEKLNDTV